jgi:chromosome segregation ATPase
VTSEALNSIKTSPPSPVEKREVEQKDALVQREEINHQLESSVRKAEQAEEEVTALRLEVQEHQQNILKLQQNANTLEISSKSQIQTLQTSLKESEGRNGLLSTEVRRLEGTIALWCLATQKGNELVEATERLVEITSCLVTSKTDCKKAERSVLDLKKSLQCAQDTLASQAMQFNQWVGQKDQEVQRKCQYLDSLFNSLKGQIEEELHRKEEMVRQRDVNSRSTGNDQRPTAMDGL